MELNRCAWVTDDSIYLEYHDHEWGKPNNIKNDDYLFEMLTLESAQAGLSWLTILKKRAGYRKCFMNYDLEKISRFTEENIQRLMLDESIVRHRKKIESVINNAKVFLKVQKEYGSFKNYIEHVLEMEFPVINKWAKISEVPNQTRESVLLSKKMKKDGFKFVGPTTCYSFMQATGFVNDHTKDCFLYKEKNKKV